MLGADGDSERIFGFANAAIPVNPLGLTVTYVCVGQAFK